MDLRRDALTGAAEMLLEIERLAQPGTTVGTVGVIHARPGAINVVPGEVTLDVDVRDSDLEAREAVVEAILAFAHDVAERRGLSVDVTPIVSDVPVHCADVVVDAVRDAVAELGLPHREMTSGAYHDAMLIAARAPVGMIFVPSRGGISHHPDEYTAPDDIDAGVAVLAGTLRRLAGQA
jgi:hydantoinase/carbamoylase family amidase